MTQSSPFRRSAHASSPSSQPIHGRANRPALPRSAHHLIIARPSASDLTLLPHPSTKDARTPSLTHLTSSIHAKVNHVTLTTALGRSKVPYSTGTVLYHPRRHLLPSLIAITTGEPRRPPRPRRRWEEADPSRLFSPSCPILGSASESLLLLLDPSSVVIEGEEGDLLSPWTRPIHRPSPGELADLLSHTLRSLPHSHALVAADCAWADSPLNNGNGRSEMRRYEYNAVPAAGQEWKRASERVNNA